MFKVLLIQNLNEMRNYSYADSRSAVSSFGFDVSLFTMENIEKIIDAMNDDADCIMFAANSLNDKVIREFVYGERFISAFREFTAAGKACLILHQNGITTKYGETNPFPFIEETPTYCLNALFKNPEDVELSFNDCFYRQFFEFPYAVTFDDILKQASSRDLRGLYWTSMALQNNDFWVPVLKDSKDNNIIVKAAKHNIIYCSLVLDWQGHTRLLNNMLINLIVNNNSLAILECGENDSLGYNYFLNSLSSSKLHFLKYNIECEKCEFGYETLVKNIKLGLHSTVLVTSGAKGKLSAEIYDSFKRYGVKIIEMQDERESQKDSFVIHSAEKSIKCYLNETELKVQQMLVSGFINKSFIKTIDVLMILTDFQKLGLTKGTYNKENLKRITSLISARICDNGSFDNTFGATCKALWYFNEFFGPNDKQTKQIWKYIEENHPENIGLIRENLNYLTSCYLMRGANEALLKADRNLLTDDKFKPFVTVGGLRNCTVSYNEYDILAVLKIGQMTDEPVVLQNILEYIRRNMVQGQLLNSQLTAAYAHNLIGYYQKIKAKELEADKKNELLSGIQSVLFEMIARLKRELSELIEEDKDSKFIDSQLYIIRTLYEFEAIVSFPITDLIDLVYTSGNYPQLMLELKNSISKAQDSRIETDKYKEDIKQYKRYKPFEKLFYIFLGVSVALLWVSITLLLEVLRADDAGARIKEVIINAWPAAFSAVVVPVIVKIYNKIKGKK